MRIADREVAAEAEPSQQVDRVRREEAPDVGVVVFSSRRTRTAFFPKSWIRLLVDGSLITIYRDNDGCLKRSI